ncbi:MAG: RNA polymerase sigma factor [bacterium]|nr:RNA polymerase sigma factor [bacterium]
MLEQEKNLIRKAKRGEPEAFGALYDHYHPKIYRFIFFKVGSREDAEDVAHQVFLQAWNKIGGYSHLGFPFSSWLYQIARNEVIDHYRTKKEASSIDDIDPEFFVSTANMQFDVDQELSLNEVRNALQALRPEYADVIIMRFVEELSVREVAVALEKSEGAVKLLQYRALEALRSVLGTKKTRES